MRRPGQLALIIFSVATLVLGCGDGADKTFRQLGSSKADTAQLRSSNGDVALPDSAVSNHSRSRSRRASDIRIRVRDRDASDPRSRFQDDGGADWQVPGHGVLRLKTKHTKNW